MDPMPPISAPCRERGRACMSRPILAGSLFLSIGLLTAPLGSRLLADDQKPPASNEQTEKSAQTTEGEPKPSATPRPKPSAAPGQASGSESAPARPKATTAKPAPPAPKSALRFDDFDLEKYHKPVPKEADEEDEAVEEPAPEPAAPGSSAAAPVPPTAPRPRPKVRPRPTPVEPAIDPMKAFKDREAMEKFRQSQIETGRLRIAKLQERLNYLNAKRDALNNPAPMLVGQTQIQNQKPGEPPPPPTPIQGPGRGLTATPGTGKTPVMGLFPPIPPPQTDEDKENDKKLKVKDLLSQVEEEIKSVQEELETAKDELAAVQTSCAGTPSQ